MVKKIRGLGLILNGKIPRMIGLFQSSLKTGIKFFTLAMLVCIGSQAGAASMIVSFPNLDSVTIYACNAGAYQGKQAPICRYGSTFLACNQADVGKVPSATGIDPGNVLDLSGNSLNPESEKNHPCACTSPTELSYLGNSIRFKLQDEAQSQALNSSPNGSSVVGKLIGSGAALTPSQFQQATFQTHISELAFDFGSELFGTQYFVDFCYVGPQPDVKKKAKCEDHKPCPKDEEPSIPNFGTSAQITIASAAPLSPDNGLSYLELSKVKMSWDVACSFYDLDALRSGKSNSGGLCLGTSCTDKNELGITDTGSRSVPADKNAKGVPLYLTPPSAESGWVGNLQGAWSKRSELGHEVSSWNSDFITIFGNVSQLLPVGNLLTNPGPPKACKMRLYFMEQANFNERLWQTTNSRFTFNWDLAPLRPP